MEKIALNSEVECVKILESVRKKTANKVLREKYRGKEINGQNTKTVWMNVAMWRETEKRITLNGKTRSASNNEWELWKDFLF